MQEKNTRSSHELINKYLAYANAIAHKLQRQYNLPASLIDDMKSAASEGLVQAAQRYDCNSQYKFSGYAYPRIRGAVIDYLRRESEISGLFYQSLKAYQGLSELSENTAHELYQYECDLKNRLAVILDFGFKGALIYRLSTEDENALLRELIEALPEKEKIIIQYYYFQGFQLTEIAHLMGGISKSWISRLHAQAINRLKELYLEETN